MPDAKPDSPDHALDLGLGTRVALALAAATFILSFTAYFLDPPVILDGDGRSVAWYTQPVEIARLFYQTASMFVLDGPSHDPDHWVFALAKLTAVGFVAVSVTGIVMRVFSRSFDAMRLRRIVADSAGKLPKRADTVTGLPPDITVRHREPAHAVVCGLGPVGLALARDLLTHGSIPARPVVAIESNPAHPNLAEAARAGVRILIGDARSESLLTEAGVQSAGLMLIVTDEDATNLEIASAARRVCQSLRAPDRQPLDCRVNMTNPAMADVFRSSPVFTIASAALHPTLFDVTDAAVRAVVRDELCLKHAPPAEGVAHWVIFGFGDAGQRAAEAAARLAHFASDRRLRLSIVDDFGSDVGRGRRDRFLAAFPAFSPAPGSLTLGPVEQADPLLPGAQPLGSDMWNDQTHRPADPAWRFDEALGGKHAIEYVVNAEFVSAAAGCETSILWDGLAARLAQSGVTPAVLIVHDSDRENFEQALRLRAAMQQRKLSLPIYVYLPREPRLADLLSDGASNDGSRCTLEPFGRCDGRALLNAVLEPAHSRLAVALHEAYSKQFAEQPQPFDALLPSLQRANYRAAEHLGIKLAAMGSRALQPADLTDEQRTVWARMEHNRWVADRLMDGWRCGSRDDVARRRESLIPWEHLSETERAKDVAQIDVLLTASAGN